MKVCSGCESKIRFPILQDEKKLGKCELCWDKQLVKKVVVGR